MSKNLGRISSPFFNFFWSVRASERDSLRRFRLKADAEKVKRVVESAKKKQYGTTVEAKTVKAT